MTGHGGWPMTVFLDPDGVPFYGGTYFPPDESRGMPSFRMVMEAIVDACEGKREEIRERAPEATAPASARSARSSPTPSAAGAAELRRATASPARQRRPPLRRLRQAPRSSRPPRRWSCCLARGETEVVRARPSTRCSPAASTTSSAAASPATRSTRVWLVPHFEKMLYDNALLAPRLPARLAGASATSATAASARRPWTGCWREMRGPEGGFYSALDADSEGEEGKFYVWYAGGDPRGARRPRRGAVLDFYGVSERGNFEGANILHLAAAAPRPPAPPGLDAARAKLLRGAREAGPARPRRQAPAVLERAGDLGPGRGRRRARPRGLPRRGARAAPSSSGGDARRRAAACCAPTRTATPT